MPRQRRRRPIPVWWPFAVGLAGEDTDGIFTNGAGLHGGTPDSTTYGFGNGNVFVKCYDLTSTTWDDLSTSGLLTPADWAANHQLLPDADAEEAGDGFAVGFASKFCQFGFNDLATGAGTLATWGADGGKWQYSTGAGTWSNLTVYDGTDATAQDGKRSLQQVGCISFAPPSAWEAVTIDGQEAYWVMYVITAAQLTQTPLIDATNKDEPFVIVGGSDSFAVPNNAEIIGVRVTDMGITVHDAAIKFVICNFTKNTFSAELTWTASQYNDTFTLASAMEVSANDVIGILVTDDAGSTVNPTMFVEFEARFRQ